MKPVVFGMSGLALTADERAFFTDADPAGYIVFARNIESPAQLRVLTDELRSLHGRDRLMILIDQEGGRVQRMKPPVWPAYPAPGAFSALYHAAPISALEAARVNAMALALDLAEAGITVNCAPMIDVRQPGSNDTVIGDRAFGDDPMMVAALGRATLDGLRQGGVLGIVKHMPGHGRALVDSHEKLPVVEENAETLVESDLAPFVALNDTLMGMTGHIIFPAWDPDRPATLSPLVIEQVIRDQIGFDGLLFSDDLDMKALAGSVPDSAVACIGAGCDIALNCWGNMAHMTEIADRLPDLAGAAQARFDRVVAAMPPLNHITDEREALIAKRDSLLALAS
ncbi:MAG: beta-N-acetylhexosaminidase [Pseudomonadota bacterium]